jgi:hypothetical protein
MLKIWSGAATKVGRVHLGAVPLRVPHPFLTIVGGIQNDRLDSLGFTEGTGFCERFLYTYPEPKPFPGWSDAGVDDFVQDQWETIFRALWAQPMGVTIHGESCPHALFMSEPARERWHIHQQCIADTVNHPGFNPAHRGGWGKMREYLGRLALVLSRLWAVTEGVPGLPDIGPDDIDRAWMLTQYFAAHFQRVHATVTGGFMDARAEKVLGWIRRNKLAAFKRSQVRSDLRRSISDEDINLALDALEVCNAIRPLERERKSRGRIPSAEFEVHPLILTM